MLTLDARVCSAKTEEVGDGGELARSAAAGVEEDDGDPENGGDPARFLLQGYRGGHGGGVGGLGFAREPPNAANRRRRLRYNGGQRGEARVGVDPKFWGGKEWAGRRGAGGDGHGLLVLQRPRRRAAWAREEVAAWRQWPWSPL